MIKVRVVVALKGRDVGVPVLEPLFMEFLLPPCVCCGTIQPPHPTHRFPVVDIQVVEDLSMVM